MLEEQRLLRHRCLGGNSLCVCPKSISFFLHTVFHQPITPETLLKWLEQILLHTRTRTSECITPIKFSCTGGTGCVQKAWHLLGLLHALKRSRQHAHGQPRGAGGTGLVLSLPWNCLCMLRGRGQCLWTSGSSQQAARHWEIWDKYTKASKSACTQHSGGKCLGKPAWMVTFHSAACFALATTEMQPVLQCLTLVQSLLVKNVSSRSCFRAQAWFFWREYPWRECMAHPGQAAPETSLWITAGEEDQGLGFCGGKIRTFIPEPTPLPGSLGYLGRAALLDN